MEIRKQLIIGLDISFSSTGVTITYLENMVAKNMEFHRLVFDKVPGKIININQHTYRLPVNIVASDLLKDNEKDWYSEDQGMLLLKSMTCCKRLINDIILPAIEKYNAFDIFVNIEGNILGNDMSQLRVSNGLVMLNSIIRSKLIELYIYGNHGIETLKMYITSPTSLKRFFTGNGSSSSDKAEMLRSFIGTFEGNKLLPDTTSLSKINDVVDSFALMMNLYYRLNVKTQNDKYATIIRKQKKRKSKSKSEPTKSTTDIIRESIIESNTDGIQLFEALLN